MASSPITSWQIDGEKVKNSDIFLVSKITEDSDCSHEIKRCLLFRRKAMTNRHSILKSRDISLPTTVHIVNAIVFPVQMWELDHKEGWPPKNAFKLWCWKRVLRVRLTARWSNQPILKEINPEYSLEGQVVKLKLEYFGHLMWRGDSLEKTLMLGKVRAEGDNRRWDG